MGIAILLVYPEPSSGAAEGSTPGEACPARRVLVWAEATVPLVWSVRLMSDESGAARMGV